MASIFSSLISSCQEEYVFGIFNCFAIFSLILVPFSNRVSVSQKIEDPKEKERLKRLAKSIKPKGFGVILRTVAEGKKVAELDKDLQN